MTNNPKKYSSNRDYKNRWKKARKTEKLARTFSKYALTKLGYSRVFLLSKKGYESTGIVDLVGIKKSGDKIELILFQVKGNKKVTKKEIERLRNIKHNIKIKYGIIEYNKGRLPMPKII